MKLNGLLSLPTKAFTLVSRPIHKHFRGDDITEREEHLHQLSVPKLLGQMVDEQVTALGPCGAGGGAGQGRGVAGWEKERQRKGELGRAAGKEGGARRWRLFQVRESGLPKTGEFTEPLI